MRAPSYASLSDVTRRRSRPLLSQAPNARGSVYSLVSSCDAPSTVHEPRISVSSTVYPESLYEEPPSLNANRMHDELEDQRSSFVPSMNDDQSSRQGVEPRSHPFAQKYPSPGVTLHSPIGMYPSSERSPFGISLREPLVRPVTSDHTKTTSSKPAIPTTPKPDFRRSRSVQPDVRSSLFYKPPSPPLGTSSNLIPHHLVSSFSHQDRTRGTSVPPTTNYLNAQERADLIRKSRKLAQVFGQTPSPLTGLMDAGNAPVPKNSLLLPIIPPRKHHSRGASEQGIVTLTSDRSGAPSLSPIRFEYDDWERSPSPFDSPENIRTPTFSQRESSKPLVRSPSTLSTTESFIEMSEPDARGEQCYSSLIGFTYSAHRSCAESFFVITYGEHDSRGSC